MQDGSGNHDPRTRAGVDGTLPGGRLARRAGGLATVALGAMALMAGTAHAASYTVSSLADGPAGPCDASCTLRDAVTAADAVAGDDTITFAPGLTGTITLTEGQLRHSSPGVLTVTGPGAATLTVSGGRDGRIFYLLNDDEDVTSGLRLSGLTLADGLAYGVGGAILDEGSALLDVADARFTDNEANNDGGAIGVIDYYNGQAPGDADQDITIARTTFTGNHTTDDDDPRSDAAGGAVYVQDETTLAFLQQSRTTRISDSTFTGNRAAGGGALSVVGNVTLRGVTISGNTATSIGGGALLGGAVDVAGTRISGNTAPAAGGALVESIGDSTVTGTTIDGNRATGGIPQTDGFFAGLSGGGGGLYVVGIYSFGGLRIQDSTISGNVVDAATGPPPGPGISTSSGGGILVTGLGGASLDVADSTISGNTADTGGGLAVSGLYGLGYGGIFGLTFGDGSAAASLDSSTVAGNTARLTGGGVHLAAIDAAAFDDRATRADAADAADAAPSATASVRLTSSVVAGNTAAGAPQDTGTDGSAQTAGGLESYYSLVQNPGTTPFRTSVGSQTAIDPQLGALADNGGPTKTMRPSRTSPLIDRGKAPAELTTDQRGGARVIDTGVANVAGGDGSDIGAVELAATDVDVPAGPPVVGPAPVAAAGPPPALPLAPAQGFAATVRGRGIEGRDATGRPSVVPVNSTELRCTVSTAAIKLCAIEVRAAASYPIPATGKRVAKGTVLAAGQAAAAGSPRGLGVKLRLTAAGTAVLASRPLGVPASVLARATGSAGGFQAAGVIRLLRSNAIRVAVPTRSATLPDSVLRQLSAVAGVFRGAVKVRCDAYTDEGARSLAITRAQAAAACRRLGVAGLGTATRTSKGHSAPHSAVPPTDAMRLDDRRIVVRVTL